MKQFLLSLLFVLAAPFAALAGPAHDGFTVYVDNQTTWTDPVMLYMWGDTNDLNGGWPGMSATGTVTIEGTEYIYFDLGNENEGLNENLIFNNSGNGKQLSDFNFTISRDLYLVITDTSVREVGAPEPETCKFYLKNESDWTSVYVYGWSEGNPECCGSWPGRQFSVTETIEGVDYIVAEFNKSDADYHFIINNNGTQFDDVVVAPANVNYYAVLTNEGVSMIADPSAISTISTSAAATWYDLSGRRIARQHNGNIYIQNGKKSVK